MPPKKGPQMKSKKAISSVLRRTLAVAAVAAVAAVGAAAAVIIPTYAVAGAHTSSVKSVSPKPTIVLVHGAWADGSSWNSVTRSLQDDGFTVDVPPNPLRGLASDSAYLASYLHGVTGPIVLVGHSYGGAVISNAATGNLNVKALVYVDAFAPAQGETIQQLVAAQPGSCLGGGGDPTKVFNFGVDPSQPVGDYDLYLKTQADLPYPGFRACFANDLSPKKAALLASTQRPLALGAISEPSGVPAWKTIPSWYLVGTQDQVIPPAEQIAMATRAGSHIVKVNASHLSMISQPEAATNLILEAVSATAS
jgi:pimeloyl-ACP methyl ester carboxylesterase